MFGMMGQLAGLSLVNPLTAVIGIGLGRRALKDERKRQLMMRRQQAKLATRRYLDELSFAVSKDSRDAIRTVQRELRDEFTARAEQLNRSTARGAGGRRDGRPPDGRAGEQAGEGHRRRVGAPGRRAQGGERLGDILLPVGAPMTSLLEQVRRVADSARRVVDATGAGMVDEIAARLDEPLRVAFAGRVKAGKSTLLNALVGEELAPTDAGECTRIVTWYRDGHTSRVTLHLRNGDERQTTFSRDDGALIVDLGAGPVDDIERIDVQWPSKRLAGMTLIDTPGLGSVNEDGSASTRRFLAIDDDGDDGPSDADAVIYLMRHLHQSDLGFLEAFHDGSVASASPVNTIAVLSRADEVGSCRPEAMQTARRIATRYRSDPRVRRLSQTVVPVSGLLAQAATTLTEAEYRALAALGRAAPGRGRRADADRRPLRRRRGEPGHPDRARGAPGPLRPVRRAHLGPPDPHGRRRVGDRARCPAPRCQRDRGPAPAADVAVRPAPRRPQGPRRARRPATPSSGRTAATAPATCSPSWSGSSRQHTSSPSCRSSPPSAAGSSRCARTSSARSSGCSTSPARRCANGSARLPAASASRARRHRPLAAAGRAPDVVTPGRRDLPRRRAHAGGPAAHAPVGSAHDASRAPGWVGVRWLGDSAGRRRCGDGGRAHRRCRPRARRRRGGRLLRSDGAAGVHRQPCPLHVQRPARPDVLGAPPVLAGLLRGRGEHAGDARHRHHDRPRGRRLRPRHQDRPAAGDDRRATDADLDRHAQPDGRARRRLGGLRRPRAVPHAPPGPSGHDRRRPRRDAPQGARARARRRRRDQGGDERRRAVATRPIRATATSATPSWRCWWRRPPRRAGS